MDLHARPDRAGAARAAALPVPLVAPRGRPAFRQQAALAFLTPRMGEWVDTKTLITHVYGRLTYHTRTATWQIMSRLSRKHPGRFEHRQLGWGSGQYRMVQPL